LTIQRAAFAAAVIIALALLWALWPSLEAVDRGGPHGSSALHPASQDNATGSLRSPDGDQAHSKIAATADRSAANSVRFPPMPPIGTPMRLAYPQIREQAEAGDAVAQCRLAVELWRCAGLPERIRSFSDFDARLGKQGQAARAREAMEQGIAKDVAVCQDFTPDSAKEPWRWMLESALNGNRSAALEFVSAGFASSEQGGSPDWGQAYRDHAPQLLQQAIAAGDPRAYQLAASFARFISDRYQLHLVATDPIHRAAYYLALLPITTPTYGAVLERQVQSFHLSEADLAEARERAATLALSLKPPPDGDPLAGDNIIGYGRWTAGAQCEH